MHTHAHVYGQWDSMNNSKNENGSLWGGDSQLSGYEVFHISYSYKRLFSFWKALQRDVQSIVSGYRNFICSQAPFKVGEHLMP